MMDHLSSIITQSPPGQVNDVLNDLRVILGDDAALEKGSRPALEQYNVDQYTTTTLSGNSKPTILCQAGQYMGRYIDPRSKHVFNFDHMDLVASNVEAYEAYPSIEPLREALDAALLTYAENHFSQPAAAVFSLDHPVHEQRQVKESVESTPMETSPPVADVEAEAIDIEGQDKPEAAEPDTNDSIEQTDVLESADKTEPDEAAGTQAEATGTQEEGTGIPEEAKPAEPALPAQLAEPEIEPKPRFGLYIVGNKYNPSNFWSGRWRSRYTFDAEKGTIEGLILVHIHYYEQGNVQLQTSLPVSLSIAAASSDPKSTAREVVKTIANAEKEYQVALNGAYAEMADKSFKGLRRALPITKQKMNWNRISNYRLGTELQKA